MYIASIQEHRLRTRSAMTAAAMLLHVRHARVGGVRLQTVKKFFSTPRRPEVQPYGRKRGHEELDD